MLVISKKYLCSLDISKLIQHQNNKKKKETNKKEAKERKDKKKDKETKRGKTKQIKYFSDSHYTIHI